MRRAHKHSYSLIWEICINIEILGAGILPLTLQWIKGVQDNMTTDGSYDE